MNNSLNNKSQLASDMIISGICKPISMIIGYIYVPIALDYLGIEKYGIWSTILTILSWISYFDIGIGNGLRNKLTESLSKKDGESRKLVSSAYAFIAIIMICITLIFAAFSSFVNWNRVFGVEHATENLAAIIRISVSFISVNFVLSICKNVLYALQKASIVSIMELSVQVINLFGVLFVKHLFDGNLFVMAVIYGLSMAIVNITASFLTYIRNKNVRPNIHYLDLYTGKSLTNLGIQFFIIQICALILFTTDSLMISFLYGAVNVTPYSTVNKLFNAIIGIYAALLSPVWSAVTKAKAEKNVSGLKKIIKKLYLIMIPFAMCIVILMTFFRPISNIWLGMELNYSAELIAFGGMYCFLNIWTNTHGTIANGLEILKEQILMAVIQAALNIPLSLFFASYLNLNSAGILLGTNITILISCIYLPVCIKKWIVKEEKYYEDSHCCK